jgi:hypothetical protein
MEMISGTVKATAEHADEAAREQASGVQQVGQAAQECHRGMRMCIHEARQQYVAGKAKQRGRRILLEGAGEGQHGRDA